MFAIVENDLEEPIATLGEVFFSHIGRLGPVANALDITIDEWRITVLTIALIRRRKIYVGRIFGFVFVNDDISFIVIRSFQKPFENPGCILGIRDPAVWVLTINAGNIVLGSCPPVDVAIGLAPPLLNAGEQSFDSGPIPFNRVGLSV